jgi:glucose uptake protein
VAIVAGVLMGFFYRFVAASISGSFTNPEPGKLTPYTAVGIFAAGLLLSNFIWNSIIMAMPLDGRPVKYIDYLMKGNV